MFTRGTRLCVICVDVSTKKTFQIKITLKHFPFLMPSSYDSRLKQLSLCNMKTFSWIFKEIATITSLMEKLLISDYAPWYELTFISWKFAASGGSFTSKDQKLICSALPEITFRRRRKCSFQ